MTKKIFAQPEMMVVEIKQNDIIATSQLGIGDAGSANDAEAPGLRNLFDGEGFYQGY